MKLVPGLYENVVTRAVDEAVRAAGAEVDSEREALNAEAAPYVLGRYLFDALVRALRNLPEEERLAQQVALTNRLIELLGEAAPNAGIDADEGPGSRGAAPRGAARGRRAAGDGRGGAAVAAAPAQRPLGERAA